MNKNIKIIFALLITAAIIGVALFFGMKKSIFPTPTQTADQTSNWKTYFNNKLKFSFKYPGDWILTDIPDQQEASLRFESPDYQLDLKFKPTKDAHVGPLLFGAKLDMYTDQVTLSNKNYNVLEDYYPKEGATGSPIKVLDRKEVIIDGQKGIRVETQWGPVKGFASSAVTSLGRTYYFNIQYAPEKRDYFLKIFDQMLSTFKFTDQSSQTTNWKTYVNNDFGISFSYPSDLYTIAASKDFPVPINPKVFTDDLKIVPAIGVKRIHPEGVDDMGPISIKKIANTTMDAWIGSNKTAEATTTGSYFPVADHIISKTTFQGYPAYLLKEKTNSQVPEDKYLVQVGKNVYYISFDKNIKPVIENILASIKFLSRT